MFVDRQAELNFLDTVLHREHPGPAQLILLYGRRRIGKTLLLRHWVEGTGVPYTYWAAQKESALLQRSRLYARVAGVQQTRFDSWADCWEAIANFYANRRHILIIDEFSYAAEAEAGMLSSLQHAWDQLFQHSQLVLILCGSHVHAMEDLLTYQSPLFGRFTGQWGLRPLPYASLEEFFPAWSVEERVAGYAIVGGVPAYWTWLDRGQSLRDNIHKMLTPGSRERYTLGTPAYRKRCRKYAGGLRKKSKSGRRMLKHPATRCQPLRGCGYRARSPAGAFIS